MPPKPPPTPLPGLTGNWRWSNQNPPPATGQFRTDSRDWDNATKVWFSNTDSDGNDHSDTVGLLQRGDIVYVADTTDSNIFAVFNIEAPAVINEVDKYRTIDVTWNNGSTTNLPANNGEILVTLIRVQTFPAPPDAHMYVDMDLNPAISDYITTDLMKNFCDQLETVTHLVNHADITANAGGAILTYSQDILPAIIGDPFPPEAQPVGG